ncbi:Ppx/GppA family phosphatase [Parapontixanthobacter aurantiacus]|uniref:Ppx/GppA family phosphatase n=1 Tax=Parapontixanthobacter aurantiacus TaxID=1463599 RepID=UPI001F27E0FF|nr:Ppx/GppA family phosphatase [Parapontixanthobacter aurantiacus]
MKQRTTRRRLRDDGLFGKHAERAIVDIGSNTVRAVIFGGSPRAPTVIHNEKVTARLGRDIASDGELAEESIELAMRGLRRYALIFDDLGIDDVTTVATAAVREASNGKAFLADVEALGFAPRVLSGEEEARFSAHGVLGAFPGASGIVADLGGGSLELVRIDGDLSDDGTTLPLGTLRLEALREGHDGKIAKPIAQMLKQAGWGSAASTSDPADASGRGGQSLYLVGGTFRAMAVYAMHQAKTPLTDPHGYELTGKQAAKLASRIEKADPSTVGDIPRISSMRAEKLPDAATLLSVLLKQLQPDRIVFSSWGLREGIIQEGLPDHMKRQDPLLAGIGVFGTMYGASPVLATRVAGWTVRAVPTRGRGEERLRLAATTLSLAAMQIEPNLRVQHATEWALYKRWLGLGPEGRAMLAATVCANGNVTDLPDALHLLAEPEQLEEAICWGLAIRLCRRLATRSRKGLQASSLVRDEDRLVLRLEEGHRDLFGVPNEKDLRQLSERLGLDYALDIVPDDSSEPIIEPAVPIPTI